MKQPKCKVCKNKECKKKFTPDRPMQTTCSFNCAIAYSKQLTEKREAKKKTKARVLLREYKKSDKPTLLQLAQKLVNQFIRLRDDGEKCISCHGDFSKGQKKNAGHYIPRSKSSLLRFNEDNLHLQCEYCNVHLHANLNNYRVSLIKKIGIERVKYLEDNKTTLKGWSVTELQEVIDVYRGKVKELKELTHFS